MSKLIDLTNQKFGAWTVLYYAGNSKWHCKCICGNEKDVNSVSLRKGTSQSCGCIKAEKAKENNGKFINEIGNRYGYLTVIAKDEEASKNSHRAYWLCRCDCGNVKSVSSKCLRDGKTRSCGCIGNSYGEHKIQSILIENNFAFQLQYGVSINKIWYRFDFAILNENKLPIYFIEFDGIQHFNTNHLHWGQTAQINQNRDTIKNQWCKTNNIPLIRIPYWHYNDLCKEDLMLETSKFIVDMGEEI